YEFYETNKYDYLNIEFLFIREEIEKIIGAKIPYIKNLSDVENSDLEPLNNNKKSVGKTVSGKSETSYLNIIQALKDELIKIGEFKNQTELIRYLSERYAGYQGLTESNLRDKFAKANLIK
ncbi:TPA: hypothetical protein R4352_001883, partial [Pasteurella multocida]|nr:hypothetical protein [Pasteurella multocida]